MMVQTLNIKKKKNILKIGSSLYVAKMQNGKFCYINNSEFKESEHPRDKAGRFTSKDDGKYGSEKEKKISEKIEIAEGYEKSVSPQRFHDKIKEAKESVSADSRWRVDVHEASDYTKDKLFVSEGGSTVAVTSDGDIISVCHREGDKIRGSDLLKKSVEKGGKKLDAYRGLFRFYAKNGFEPVSWCEFDENYAPEGWDKNRDEKEPVVFWKYTGKVYEKPWEEFSSFVKASKDYEEAMNIRDSKMEKK